MKKLRKHLSYANVMSSLAVFLLLGGGAAIAANLPPNSVGSPQIKRNGIRTGDIGPKQVRIGKIDLNAINAGRLRDDAVTTDKIQDDAVTGDKVDQSSLSEVLRTPVRRVVAASATTSGVGQFRNVTASCPTGERGIAGGGMWTQITGGPTGFNILQGTRPVPSFDGTETITGWQATGITNNAAARQLRAYVICVPS